MKVGDTISVIDDTISGVVKSIFQNLVLIETSDGFELEYQKQDLIVIDDVLNPNFSGMDMRTILSEKQSQKRKQKKFVKTGRRSKQPPMEVDLHIHHLVDNTKNLSNFDILNIQIDTAKRQLDFAISKRIQSIVFIHGVGEGVLREELYTLLRRYDNIDFFDADYQKYGMGATEVYIFQNSSPRKLD